MPRSLSAPLITKLNTQFGTEPINIIEIQWNSNGNRTSYADRDVQGIPGRITELSNLDFVINISDGSDSAEIDVALSDINGDLKTIIDSNDIHKKDVWIYQWFEGTSLDDKALIFRGEINSPITWNEGDRTLKFNVVSKIEDAEIGFSIEEGQFPNPPSELIGEPWPLKFGTTIKVPALRFTSPAKGILSTGVGIKDFTLPFRIEAAKKLICPQVFRGYTSRYGGTLNLSLIITPVYTTDTGCALSRCETIDDLQNQLTQQRKYEFEKITIIDGEKFPQDQEITLDIDGGKFTGSFEGNVFTITSRKHPEQDEIGIPTEDSVKASLKKRFDDALASGCTHLAGGLPDGYGGVTTSGDAPADPSRKLVEASEKSFEFYNAVPTSDFFWANPGATVTLDTGEPLVYVTNILPETIHNVAAFRDFDAGRKLVTVPPDLYTVRFSDFGTYTVTEVVLDKPLSRIEDGWEDDLYITSTSTVGPNTVDIIEWLIEKYTDLGIDTTSFDDVRVKLENYPSDFPILERKNILQVLQEIAFQARCVIYLRDGKFFLKYLPELPPSEETISESDVDANTLELFHTDTEEIVTKLIAEWKRDYSIDDPNKIILRHNIEKYGTQEDTFDFYIYNEIDYVHKSATFWLIRKANTWRLARLSTPIHKLKLETFDGVDLSLPDFAPTTIRGTITKADYNSDERRLDFEIWTPVKSGTQVPYDFAHPHDIDETLQWPTEAERDDNLIGSGTAPGFLATAPAGHPLSGDLGLAQGFSFGPCASQGLAVQSFVDQTCAGGNGDTYPSDEGDTKKEKELEGGFPPEGTQDPGEINVGRGPEDNFGGKSEMERVKETANQALQTAKQAQATANAANEATGGRGSGNQPRNTDDPFSDLPGREELEENEDQCIHIVRITLTRPTVLFKAGEIGGQSTGRFGAGNNERQDTLYFNSCCEAQQATTAVINAHNARQQAESYELGKGPYPTNANHTCDTRAQCLGKPPCNEQDRDEGGEPIGKKPTPIGYDRDQVSEPPEGEPPGSPDDYWDELSDFFDPKACAPSDPSDCPPPEEGGEENEEDQPFGDPEDTSQPAGPDTDGDGVADETWTPGDSGDPGFPVA